MRVWAVYRRELLSYFVSPVAYIILFVFLLFCGVTFYLYLKLFRGDIEGVLRSFYGAAPFWFLVLLIPPLLTMRSFAEERRSGTFELLVTTGTGETELVMGKFLAAWTYFSFLWITLWPILFMVDHEGNPEWGVVIALHLGLLLVGALFSSVGVFASTLTQNQLAAASCAVIINILIFVVGYFRNLFRRGDLELRYLEFVSPSYHFATDFSNGVFDVRYVVLYGTLTAAFLFFGVKSLERRRWW